MTSRERYAVFIGLMFMNIGITAFFDGIMASQGKNFSFLASLAIVAVSNLTFLAGFYSYLVLTRGEEDGRR